jgi:hypothetical protein
MSFIVEYVHIKTLSIHNWDVFCLKETRQKEHFDHFEMEECRGDTNG